MESLRVPDLAAFEETLSGKRAILTARGEPRARGDLSYVRTQRCGTYSLEFCPRDSSLLTFDPAARKS